VQDIARVATRQESAQPLSPTTTPLGGSYILPDTTLPDLLHIKPLFHTSGLKPGYVESFAINEHLEIRQPRRREPIFWLIFCVLLCSKCHDHAMTRPGNTPFRKQSWRPISCLWAPLLFCRLFLGRAPFSAGHELRRQSQGKKVLVFNCG
jgi:hypothetical protein